MPAVYMPDTNICSDITREFARVAGLRVEDWVAEDQAGWPAPAGGQDPIPDMAGAPGFEPGITGPKPVALPLGHAPSRGLQHSTDPDGFQPDRAGVSRISGRPASSGPVAVHQPGWAVEIRLWAASAAAASVKSAKQVAPDPDMRVKHAPASRPSAASASGISGTRLRAASERSLPAAPSAASHAPISAVSGAGSRAWEPRIGAYRASSTT